MIQNNPIFIKRTTIPKWFCNQSLLLFLAAFGACTIVYGYAMYLRFALVSILSVLLFFVGGQYYFVQWSRVSGKQFLEKVFLIGFFVRFLWVCYCYFYFNPTYYDGNVFGDSADVSWYMPCGKAIADWIRTPGLYTLDSFRKIWHVTVDDIGYPIWLGIINVLTFGISDVFVPMVVKCFVGALTARFIYLIGQRHFGEDVGRMAAIFTAFNPNMIYWCGTMMKEVEMVFLCCLFVNEMDKSLGNNVRLTFRALLPASLIGMILFLFRSALGLVAFAAVMAHVILASHRIISLGKKVLAGVLVAFVLLVGMGEGLRQRVVDTIETVQSDSQKKNMEWRARRKDVGGRANEFAKYAGAAVFAPFIVSIPFPTFNMANEGNIVQLETSGGSFIKNILSFFVIFSLFLLLFSGEWRIHVFIIAYMLGYMVCLVLSPFAQSGRFHMPIIPMIMLFGAYGLSIVQHNKKWKKYWPMMLALEFVICLGWNWFKLKGRGMI